MSQPVRYLFFLGTVVLGYMMSRDSDDAVGIVLAYLPSVIKLPSAYSASSSGFV